MEDEPKSSPVRFRLASSTDAEDVLHRMLNSEGERVHWEMEALSASYFVFTGNTQELLAIVAQVENPENRLKLWDLNNRDKFKLVQRDTIRLFHNFVASAFALRDHTEVIARNLYENHPFQNEYRAKVKEVFSKSSVAGFVQGLRNWMLHRGLVPVTMQMSYPDGKGISEVLLHLDQLKAWGNWDTRAKQYLATLSTSPRLQIVAESYAELVERFYLWLEQRMRDIHALAFQETSDLATRLEELQAEMSVRKSRKE
jgi:hypothetical protein